ncbi:cyclic nucleotide-binding domain-containing protein [Streptomyces sp. TRM66268-LWL]|uniref:Cyclic nucleotide-binding domain-containing protein n=1 Tax=Streptomyces polyasparticus TaxID=2767826 RepID=A0ABR7SPJ8_9ACTN|nr:cyclic nucleotide-binding domain-containing protein [Streptomyces polyasparticus]MBC9717395.1 cyclic nucleotide-binding domain-containing protein [Streptomyces polyasparticus]
MTRILKALDAAHRERLLRIAREVNFPAGTRLFNEGGHADRFWIVRSGTVALDMHVPGRRPAVIETLGFGELVGWSWLFPPCVWHLGAEAASPVRAYEFDATAVRLMCDDDPELGRAVGHWVGQVLAHRLHSARVRLLDLYAPHGSGEPR